MDAEACHAGGAQEAITLTLSMNITGWRTPMILAAAAIARVPGFKWVLTLAVRAVTRIEAQ
jgi:hypothetical protein